MLIYRGTRDFYVLGRMRNVKGDAAFRAVSQMEPSCGTVPSSPCDFPSIWGIRWFSPAFQRAGNLFRRCQAGWKRWSDTIFVFSRLQAFEAVRQVLSSKTMKIVNIHIENHTGGSDNVR